MQDRHSMALGHAISFSLAFSISLSFSFLSTEATAEKPGSIRSKFSLQARSGKKNHLRQEPGQGLRV